MIKLISLNMLTSLVIVYLLTVIVTINCDEYKAIYVNPKRPSSIIFGTFQSSLSSLESTDLIAESIVECKFINYPLIMRQLYRTSEIRKLRRIIMDVDKFDLLAENCDPIDLNQQTFITKPRGFSFFGLRSEDLIAPGTKWCGPGNRSTSYDDLGTAVETDKCCRDHDYCPMFIPAGETAFGLYNDRPYTASHCDCDKQFRNCLKTASKIDIGAPFFGMIYFNVLQQHCFHELPHGECLEYSDPQTQEKCIKYANTSEPVYVFDLIGNF